MARLRATASATSGAVYGDAENVMGPLGWEYVEVGRLGLRDGMPAPDRAPESSADGLRPFAVRERRRASQPFVAPAVQPP